MPVVTVPHKYIHYFSTTAYILSLTCTSWLTLLNQGQPWQVWAFIPWCMLPSQSPHDLVCILHHQMIHTLLSPGTLRGYLSMDALKPAEGIIGLVPVGDGPLRPVPVLWYYLAISFLLLAATWSTPFNPCSPRGKWCYHLGLQSSIIIWQLISSRNTSHPPLAYSNIPHTATAVSLPASYFFCYYFSIRCVENIECLLRWSVEMLSIGCLHCSLSNDKTWV